MLLGVKSPTNHGNERGGGGWRGLRDTEPTNHGNASRGHKGDVSVICRVLLLGVARRKELFA